jgi:hypothetical protein
MAGTRSTRRWYETGVLHLKYAGPSLIDTLGWENDNYGDAASDIWPSVG